jgi:hypothetical protein
VRSFLDCFMCCFLMKKVIEMEHVVIKCCYLPVICLTVVSMRQLTAVCSEFAEKYTEACIFVNLTSQ